MNASNGVNIIPLSQVVILQTTSTSLLQAIFEVVYKDYVPRITVDGTLQEQRISAAGGRNSLLEIFAVHFLATGQQIYQEEVASASTNAQFITSSTRQHKIMP